MRWTMSMCFFVLEAQFLTLMLTWDSCRVCVLGYSLAWLGSIVDLVQDCGLETLHMFQCLGVRWPMARLKVVCGKACRCVCFSERCVFSCRSWSARKTKQSPSLDGACIATATNRLPDRHASAVQVKSRGFETRREQENFRP